MKQGRNRSDLIRQIEDEFKVRLGGEPSLPKGAAGRGRTVGALLRRLGAGSKSRPGRTSSGGWSERQQRVVIKVSYTVHRGARGGKALREHTRYLGRDSASLDGQAGRFYNDRSDEVDATDEVRRWQGDRHHFRLIISPEYANDLDSQRDGLGGYVRRLMKQVERDLGTKLQWLAINHHNTDDLHAHVLLRGRRADGADLVIPRQYLSHGMRQAAQRIATQRLGERTPRQVHEALQQQATAERFTPLDAAIERSLDVHRQIRLRGERGQPISKRRRPYLAARLQHLQRMGLATKGRGGRWTIHPEFSQTLRQLGMRNDIIKNLHAKLGRQATQVLAYEPRRQAPPLRGHVRDTGLHDELRDQRYLLIEDRHQQLHYVRLSPRASQFEIGEAVRVHVNQHGQALVRREQVRSRSRQDGRERS